MNQEKRHTLEAAGFRIGDAGDFLGLTEEERALVELRLAVKVRPFPWKCGTCRQREVYPVEEEYTTEIAHDGRIYTVTVPRLQLFRCKNCGKAVLDTAACKHISSAFRQQAGLLGPEEIRQNREALGLTQEELAAQLGVAVATLSRWETGRQIQQRSLDRLMRLFFQLPEVREALVAMSAETT